MSQATFWCHDVTKAPESFDFSLLSGAFKLFSDNKPRYHFRHIQQVLFATDDVKMMSEVDFCSFFNRRHVYFLDIPLFELDSGKQVFGYIKSIFPVSAHINSVASIVCFWVHNGLLSNWCHRSLAIYQVVHSNKSDPFRSPFAQCRHKCRIAGQM